MKQAFRGLRFIHLLFPVLASITISAQAQTRVTKLGCGKMVAPQHYINFEVEKSVAYGVDGGINLKFSIDAKGMVDGESGALSGGTSINASATQISPNKQEFTIKDDGGDNSASWTSLSRLTKEAGLPGNALVLKVKTQNPHLPFLIVKGIFGNLQPGDLKMMNANISVSNGKEQQSLGNYDINCLYSIKE